MRRPGFEPGHAPCFGQRHASCALGRAQCARCKGFPWQLIAIRPPTRYSLWHDGVFINLTSFWSMGEWNCSVCAEVVVFLLVFGVRRADFVKELMDVFF